MQNHPQKAIIYCRVSSRRQVKEGDGLNSQETRCREYAKSKGLNVVKVIKEEGVSGGKAERNGINELLAFLTAHREPMYVIIDDISRLARDVTIHTHLHAAIRSVGGILASPSTSFGDAPEEIFAENIMASVAQYHRQQNAKQVNNRMAARMKNGYYVLRAPQGYKYEKQSQHGKILVRDEPLASLIQEALEGFANGRFMTQVEVQQFLGASHYFKSGKTGADWKKIKNILQNVIYSGYIEYARWNVELTSAKHEPLISYTTHLKIKAKLEGKPIASDRSDLSDDFPLRGVVHCNDCERPMTAYWAKGRTKRYPYYRCYYKPCISYRKDIKRDLVQKEFEALLSDVTPSEQVLALTKAIVRDLHKKEIQVRGKALKQVQSDLEQKQRDIKALTNEVINAPSKVLKEVYTQQIEELHQEITAIEEGLVGESKVDISFDEAVRTAFDFMRNPLSV